MWKRKIGEKVIKRCSEDVSDSDGSRLDRNVETMLFGTFEDDKNLQSEELPFKRPKLPSLEDSSSKAKRLKSEGTTLAEAGRYWEAIRRFDGAVQLTPSDATIHEMKAQAYMQLEEVWPALSSAEEAVRLDPLWYIGHQTLGRARLGVGDVHLALLSFLKAVHLNPTNIELVTDDLMWARSLDEQRKEAASKNVKAVAEAKETESSTIVIADYSSETESKDNCDAKELLVYSDFGKTEEINFGEKQSQVEVFRDAQPKCFCKSTKDLVKMNLK